MKYIHVPHLPLFINNSWKSQGSRRFCHPVVSLQLNITILCNASTRLFVKWLLLFCLGEKCWKHVKCSLRAGLFQHNIHPWCRIDEDFEDHILNLILFPEYEYNRFCLCFRTVHHCINASDTYSDNMHYHGGRYVWIVFFCRAHIVFSSSY